MDDLDPGPWMGWFASASSLNELKGPPNPIGGTSTHTLRGIVSAHYPGYVWVRVRECSQEPHPVAPPALVHPTEGNVEVVQCWGD